MLTAEDLKCEALCWIRFALQYKYVGTEVGFNAWIADVFGANDKVSIEVETKISVSDFRADFVNKEAKHKAYAQGISSIAPSYFWFLATEAVAGDPRVEADIEAYNPKAGLLYYDEDAHAKAGRRLVVARRAERLHGKPPPPKWIKILLSRMGSELCGLHMARARFYDDVGQALRVAHEEILEEVRSACDARPPVDVEDVDGLRDVEGAPFTMVASAAAAATPHFVKPSPTVTLDKILAAKKIGCSMREIETMLHRPLTDDEREVLNGD